MGAEYTHNYAAFGKQVLCAPFMKSAMGEAAERIMVYAISISPVRTGRYKSSFKVTTGIRSTGTRRAYGAVTNSAPYAAAVEFGLGNVPRHRVLGKSIGLA